MAKVRTFSLQRYVEEALRRAEYDKDENGIVIAKVPDASGFFAQGDSVEEARENLKEVIEGNVLLALQLRLELPPLKGIDIEERDVQTKSAQA
ncbi:MAG TPA: hypothetical protein DCX03_03650 [Bacteroidales bacterium]|nr:hypothetical protein [Bacteroidales bacterium]